MPRALVIRSLIPLAVCLAAPARADVVVLVSGAEQALAEREPAIRALLERVPGSNPPQMSLRGKIGEVEFGNPRTLGEDGAIRVPPPRTWRAWDPEADAWTERTIPPGSPARVRVVLARVSPDGSRLDWPRGAAVWLDMAEIAKIEHELDSTQDLHWLLGNRNVLLAAKLGRGPHTLPVGGQSSRDVAVNAWEAYFLRAAGLPFPRVADAAPGEARARRATALGRWPEAAAAYQTLGSRAGDPADRARYALYARLCGLPDLEGTGDPALPTLQEGWLVSVLRDGPMPLETPADQQALQDRVKTALDRGDPFPLELRIPRSGQPGDLLGCDVNQTVATLLRIAAADDWHGGAVMGQRSGSSGTFYLIGMRVVDTLCALADGDPYVAPSASGARARELGLRARATVITALEAAAPGQVDAAAARNRSQAAVIAEVERDPTLSPQARAKLLAQLRGRRSAGRPRLATLSDLPALEVDPSVVAYGALKLIQGSRAWRWAEWDRVEVEGDGGRRTLVGYVLDRSRTALSFLERRIDRGGDEVFASIELPWSEIREVRDGGSRRLVRALAALARPTERGDARGGDAFRARRRGDPRDLLADEAFRALEWLLRNDTASAQVYRRHALDLLVEGDEAEREFVRDALARVGFGSPEDVERVVARLFELALRRNEPNEVPETVLPASYRASLQQAQRATFEHERRRRFDALTTLAYLADLTRRARPGTSQHQIGTRVLERIDELLDQQAKGWSGQADRQFFEAIEQLGGEPAAMAYPPRAELYQASASVLLQRYRARIESMQRESRERLAALEARREQLIDFEAQKATLEQEMDRIDAMQDRLQALTGG